MKVIQRYSSLEHKFLLIAGGGFGSSSSNSGGFGPRGSSSSSSSSSSSTKEGRTATDTGSIFGTITLLVQGINEDFKGMMKKEGNDYVQLLDESNIDKWCVGGAAYEALILRLSHTIALLLKQQQQQQEQQIPSSLVPSAKMMMMKLITGNEDEEKGEDRLQPSTPENSKQKTENMERKSKLRAADHSLFGDFQQQQQQQQFAASADPFLRPPAAPPLPVFAGLIGDPRCYFEQSFADSISCSSSSSQAVEEKLEAKSSGNNNNNINNYNNNVDTAAMLSGIRLQAYSSLLSSLNCAEQRPRNQHKEGGEQHAATAPYKKLHRLRNYTEIELGHSASVCENALYFSGSEGAGGQQYRGGDQTIRPHGEHTDDTSDNDFLEKRDPSACVVVPLLVETLLRSGQVAYTSTVLDG
eukprot:jgi/Bigna1/131808/aug1.15_g6516